MAHSLKRLPNPSIAKPRHNQKTNLYRFLTLVLLFCTAFFVIIYTGGYGLRLLSYYSHALAKVSKICRRLLRLYQRQLHLHPLESRAITAGIIFFVADVFAQGLKNGGKEFSLERLGRYTVYGLVVMGPFLYLWYAVMNEYGPEDDLRGSLQKCLFEQITLEPLCISMYIVYDGIICRKGWEAIRTGLDRQFFALWFKNAIFWLPANFANYYIGTPDLRVVFANLCSLFWNIYFSTKVNRIPIPAPTFEDRAKYMPLFNHDRDGQTRTPSDLRKVSSNPVPNTRRLATTLIV